MIKGFSDAEEVSFYGTKMKTQKLLRTVQKFLK